MNALPFVKMHGLGNDFVVVEARHLPAGWDQPQALSQLAVSLGDRHFGVGGDGILVIAPPQEPDTAGQFIYYNNDGTVAEMCGNGIRCFARYMVDHGLVEETTFTLSSLAGHKTVTVTPDGQVRVNMGAPRFEPRQIPFLPEADYQAGRAPAPLPYQDQLLQVWPVNMGNPHAVLFDSLQAQPLNQDIDGPALEVHPAFPAKINVEFVEQTAAQTLKVRVWERGCGWTLACGTGACAVAAAAIRAGLVSADEPVFVDLPGGRLTLQWSGQDQDPIYMTGPATEVFSGTLPASFWQTMEGRRQEVVHA